MGPRTERLAGTLDASGWDSVHRFLPIAKKEARRRLRGFARDADLVEDIATDSLIAAVASLDESKSSITTWVKRKVRYECLEFVRNVCSTSRRKLNFTSIDSVADSVIARRDADFSDGEFVDKILSSLERKRRRAIQLVAIDGHSGPKAALLMGCSRTRAIGLYGEAVKDLAVHPMAVEFRDETARSKRAIPRRKRKSRAKVPAAAPLGGTKGGDSACRSTAKPA